jgi:hypothetical protein
VVVRKVPRTGLAPQSLHGSRDRRLLDVQGRWRPLALSSGSRPFCHAGALGLVTAAAEAADQCLQVRFGGRRAARADLLGDAAQLAQLVCWRGSGGLGRGLGRRPWGAGPGRANFRFS